MAKLSKRLKEAKGVLESETRYPLEEALSLVEKLPKAKFDETLEVSIKLGVDPRKAEENIRSTVTLPHGTGKTLRVVAFCKGDQVKQAEDAGADFVGAEDLVAKIQGGWMEFDAAVAAPDVMGLVGRIGKLLGPRGLMPNPKVGTVTRDVGPAVQAIKSGRIEFRVEKAGIVHAGVGKVSFGSEKLKENVDVFMEAIMKAKPKSSKGVYLERAHLATTMGVGIKLDVTSFRNAV